MFYQLVEQHSINPLDLMCLMANHCNVTVVYSKNKHIYIIYVGTCIKVLKY